MSAVPPPLLGALPTTHTTLAQPPALWHACPAGRPALAGPSADGVPGRGAGGGASDGAPHHPAPRCRVPDAGAGAAHTGGGGGRRARQGAAGAGLWSGPGSWAAGGGVGVLLALLVLHRAEGKAGRISLQRLAGCVWGACLRLRVDGCGLPCRCEQRHSSPAFRAGLHPQGGRKTSHAAARTHATRTGRAHHHGCVAATADPALPTTSLTRLLPA